MSQSSKSDSPLHRALLQSGQLYAFAHYCNTVAQFEQNKDAEQLFSAIQAETLQHSQGHLDFLRQHSNRLPSSSTDQNRKYLAELLRNYSRDCRNIWQQSVQEDRADIADWLENTAKAVEEMANQLSPNQNTD